MSLMESRACVQFVPIRARRGSRKSIGLGVCSFTGGAATFDGAQETGYASTSRTVLSDPQDGVWRATGGGGFGRSLPCPRRRPSWSPWARGRALTRTASDAGSCRPRGILRSQTARSYAFASGSAPPARLRPCHVRRVDSASATAVLRALVRDEQHWRPHGVHRRHRGRATGPATPRLTGIDDERCAAGGATRLECARRALDNRIGHGEAEAGALARRLRREERSKMRVTSGATPGPSSATSRTRPRVGVRLVRTVSVPRPCVASIACSALIARLRAPADLMPVRESDSSWRQFRSGL
jgi:hypothetical protein